MTSAKNQQMTSRSPPGLFYFVAVAVFTGEVAALIEAFAPSGLLEACGLHAASVTLCIGWVLFSHRRCKDRLGLFLLPLTAAAGAFGAGIGLLAAIVHARCAAETVAPADWIASLFERNQDRETDHLHERIQMGLDDFGAAGGVEPFRDILSGGGILQKQMAIAKIARYFRPAFAPLLLQAAQDRNAAVRVQAATALAKIERDFMARYIRLENELKELPDHDPEKLRLADLYDQYAHADLVDEKTRQSLRRKAIHILESCLAQGENPQWRLKLARLYIRENLPEKARGLLQMLIKTGEAPKGAMLWYMEALFRLRMFAELRALAKAQAPRQNLTGDSSLTEIESLPDVWEGSAIWGTKTFLPPVVGAHR